MTYAAPLEEMRFVLDRLAGLPQIAALPGFEDAQPDVVEAILTEAARFATEVLAPLNATGDHQGCRWEAGRVTTPDGFPLAYRQFVDAGWHAVPVNPAIGGQGMPALLSSAVAEMWKSANLAFLVHGDIDQHRLDRHPGARRDGLCRGDRGRAIFP
jgi:acyl-CoA dehydrogenase